MLLLVGQKAPHGLLGHEQAGDVVVHAEYPVHAPLLVADVDGAGLDDPPVVGPQQVAGPILQILRVLLLHGLQGHLGGAVAGLPVGHVAVLDGHDGVLRVAAGEIVDQHLAVVAELHGQRLGQPLVEIKVHTIRPFRAWLRDALLSTYDI